MLQADKKLQDTPAKGLRKYKAIFLLLKVEKENLACKRKPFNFKLFIYFLFYNLRILLGFNMNLKGIIQLHANDEHSKSLF
jgi:hypothetical protein